MMYPPYWPVLKDKSLCTNHFTFNVLGISITYSNISKGKNAKKSSPFFFLLMINNICVNKEAKLLATHLLNGILTIPWPALPRVNRDLFIWCKINLHKGVFCIFRIFTFYIKLSNKLDRCIKIYLVISIKNLISSS